MIKASNRLTSLRHRLGAGRRVRLDASKGTAAPKINQGTGASTVTLAVNRVQQKSAAGKLTTRVKPHAPSRGLIPICLVSLVALGIIVSSASAETLQPWYRLSSVSSPTYLLPAKAATQEVQEITVSATAGNFYLEDPENHASDFFPPVPSDATPAEVQSVLEGFYGTGNVQVGKKTVTLEEEAEHIRRFLVTFAQSRAYGLIAARSFPEPFSTYAPLTGGEKGGLPVENEAAIESRQVTQGAFEGSKIIVSALNAGDALAGLETAAGGVPVSIEDTLPPGLEALSIEGGTHVKEGIAHCEFKTLTCVFGEGVGALAPFVDPLEVSIGVNVRPGASSGEANTVSISGGEGFACHEVAAGTGNYADSGCVFQKGPGSFERQATAPAPSAHISHPIVVAKPGEATPFGVEDYEMTNELVGGQVATHAGSHPFQTTFTLNLNNTVKESAGRVPAALAKDLTFDLPPGWIGNPSAYPRCPLALFSTLQCPADTIVGVGVVEFQEPTLNATSLAQSPVPLYNVEPSPGEPARFAFKPAEVPVFIDTSVRTGEDYGITAHVQNIPQTVGFVANSLTFWGVPGDASHSDARGDGCLQQLEGQEKHLPCTVLETSSPPPFSSLPTSCTGPLQSTVSSDSWAAAGIYTEPVVSPMPAMDGCGSLQFGSQITVTPDLEAASTPSGLAVDIHVPQEEALNAGGFAPADLKNITVALPEGLHLNPSAADGLQACSEEQAGFTGFRELNPLTQPGVQTPQFERELKNKETGKDEPSLCPNASKVGTATIKLPVLPQGQYLKGFVYLASQEANPFGSLVAMYLVAKDRVSGIVVKLAGQVSLSPTGQITATFDNNPQGPLEDAEVEFFGGERAPLATPVRCGSYTTNAFLEPWTNGPGVDEDLHSTSEFPIVSGAKTLAAPGGGPCPGASLPFAPSLTGGALNLNAGAFSPFDATFSRQSGEQNMQSIEAHLPPGLSGILAGVELCPEPQANLGECGPNSLVGETTVSVGVGGEPFTVSGGKFYLTGPYNGTGSCTVGTPGCAPFGLSFVVPAKAGPFDLAHTQHNHPACDCVLVRGKIEIDPLTTAITIVSNPPGTPGSIPTSLEGIPLEIQHVNAITTRSNFQFNPTNCNKLEVTGTIHSSEGATDTLGVPLQVTNCAALKFGPKFTASTQGKTSKADGASLTLKVTRPSGPSSGQANFALAKIELPKQLPSRLTTLQKACTAAQFDANPAGCPAASDIGHVKVQTPIFPVPLEGPAYFVSHGGEAFPSVIFVLQGYGVTIDIVSTTFISKSGITSATIKTVPDQPFTSFELTFGEKQYSALAANGNLCTSKLTMPTEFVAQNGAKIKQSTPIAVTGCAKVKTRSQKLKAALAACHKKHNKGERQKCEKAARKKFGPLKKAKKGKK